MFTLGSANRWANRLIEPQGWFWRHLPAAAAGGATYVKSGAVVADTTLAGTGAFEAVEAGTASSAARSLGADVFASVEAGVAVSDTVLGGAKEWVYGGELSPVTHTPTDGIYDQTTTNGTVTEYSRGGVVVVKARSGRVVERPRDGTVREVVRSGSHDESPTGGEIL